jgi:signal transduction histidine kinase
VSAEFESNVSLGSFSRPHGFLLMSPRLGRYLVLGFCALVAYGTVQATQRVTEGRTVGAWVATVIFLAIFPLAARYPAVFSGGDRINVSLILVIGACGIALQALAPQAPSFAVIATAMVMTGIRLDGWTGRIVASFIGAAYVGAVLSGPRINSAGVLSLSLGLLFAYIAAISVRNLRVEQRRTETLLQEVVAGREAQVLAAQLEERASLAREIHDILAHTLSGLSIQLEGARMLVAQRPGDPEALQAVERSSRLAREGLNEARRAMGSLRGEQAPGVHDIPRLLEEYEQDTGTRCILHIDGEKFGLSAEASLTIFRIVQEALTNVRKHVAAERVEVSLRYLPEHVELLVANDGASRRSPVDSGGHGLMGMRERAERLGGTLESGPTDTGFRVRLLLPVRT